MNRDMEYRALLSEQLPEALETTVERALARERALQRRIRRALFSVGGLAACLTAFVLLVNLSVPFAYACGRVPVLRELAKAVAWSSSLSAAVENEYVQPIGESQTVNGITATIEYLIVDQKQLNIFFTLKGDYDDLSAERLRFSEEQRCSVLGANFRQPPGTLLRYTLDYVDRDVPDSLTVTFGVTTWEEPVHAEGTAPERSYEDDMLDPVEEPEKDILAEFTFTLTFDPTFTARGEIVPVDTPFTLDGQSLKITDVEIYPTHVRVDVMEADANNSAWLKDLEFYLEDERGERFAPISNGVTGTGDEDSPMMISYRLESPYFADCRSLTLHITGALWLDKDMERVRIDLPAARAEELPEGVTLHRTEERDGGWILTFRISEEEGQHRSPFTMEFYDEAGIHHDTERSGYTTGDGGYAEQMLPLPGYHEDTVWLCPSYSRSTTEDVPVTIPVK